MQTRGSKKGGRSWLLALGLLASLGAQAEVDADNAIYGDWQAVARACVPGAHLHIEPGKLSFLQGPGKPFTVGFSEIDVNDSYPPPYGGMAPAARRHVLRMEPLPQSTPGKERLMVLAAYPTLTPDGSAGPEQMAVYEGLFDSVLAYVQARDDNQADPWSACIYQRQ